MGGKRSDLRGRNAHGRGASRRGGEMAARPADKKHNRFRKRENDQQQRKEKYKKLRQTTEDKLAGSKVEEIGSKEDNHLTFENDDNAYNALLMSLQEKGGSFADAYAQRQREEQGASSSEEEEEGTEAIDFGHTPAEDDEIQAGNEDEVELKDEDEIESYNFDDGDVEAAEEEAADEEGEEAVEEEEEEEEDEDGEGVESYISSDGDVEDDANIIRVASSGQAGICSDTFRSHLEHQLDASKEADLLKSLERFGDKLPAEGTSGMSWVFTASSSSPKAENSLAAYAVKKRLQDSWRKVYEKSSHGDFKSQLQRQFFSLCSSYKDLLHTNRLVGTGSTHLGQEDLTTMDAYVLHILNHVMKTRDLITKNNEKLRQPSTGDEPSDPPRDQGYTRPKVLILLPYRSSALKFVNSLLRLMPLPQKTNVENKGRFFDDFGVEDDNVEADIDIQPKKGKGSTKPEDFLVLFSGNNDDHFRIGIKFTRKSVKLYSEFYSSDIIIASPVGLMTRIGEADTKKETDVDFLSSIEIAVVDYTDVILMQNWSHVVSVFDHLNQLPVHQHGTDFMRIREWYLNGHARRYRQTIILSSFPDAGVNALFRRSCMNHAGKVKAHCEYEGTLSKIVLQVRQVYEKVECTEISDVDDSRFEFFVKQVFPRIKNSLQDGTMIFTRSYFDFVRLRNFFKAESASFCLLGEYTKQSDISRARLWFFHGKRKILLYTERAHYFHRYKIRGIKDLIFYSLPDHAHFYVEILNLLEGKENPSCTVLFSRFDSLQLERIVGTTRSRRMLSSSNKLFMFC